jgi:LysR family transcriptional regulator, glycine cleavage system transcriptional activator
MSGKLDLKRLPPLKALRGFEAATRLQSIRDAAAELCLTHPAVSHQVQQIEEALGVKLFVHEGRHIVSTEEGQALYPYVRAAFLSLLEGIDVVQRHALEKPLRVQTYVTASIRWLARRMPEFLRQHPEIKLTLSTCSADWEFDEAHADVGLVYFRTPPDPARYHWVPLFDYVMFPVCSPDLAARMGPGARVADLMAQPLVAIYTEVQNWQLWFEAASVAFEPKVPYAMVDTLAVALEMALNGEGIALVNGPFVDADLASGRLVLASPHRVVCPGAWGMVCRKDIKDDLRVSTFMTWMAGQVATAEPELA